MLSIFSYAFFFYPYVFFGEVLQNLCSFFNLLFHLLIVEFESSLYILDSCPLTANVFHRTFSHSVATFSFFWLLCETVIFNFKGVQCVIFHGLCLCYIKKVTTEPKVIENLSKAIL